MRHDFPVAFAVPKRVPHPKSQKGSIGVKQRPRKTAKEKLISLINENAKLPCLTAAGYESHPEKWDLQKCQFQFP